MGFLVDRPQTNAAHEVSYPVVAARDLFSRQVVDHAAAVAAGILQVETVDPGHDLQRRLTHRHWAVVEG